MKFKVNAEQLPIKAHYFCFMAAMGPILPFLNVYGRQLGISPLTMGSITAILPVFYLTSKPLFGFVIDYYRNKRKTIFMGIFVCGSLSFVLLYFLPKQPGRPEKYLNSVFNSTSFNFCNVNQSCDARHNDIVQMCQKISYQTEVKCLWNCGSPEQMTLSVIIRDDFNETFVPLCWNNTSLINQTNEINISNCNVIDTTDDNCNLTCEIIDIKQNETNGCLYKSLRFWLFVLLMSIGSIGFNVTNSITDAICFDVLGEGGHMGYGRQRVWGTIGFGITALIAGYAIDLVSKDAAVKSYTPAFIIIMIFTLFDVYSCTKLELPIMAGSENIAKDVIKLLKMKIIAIFLVFATIAGIFDSFIIYYMFWYLDDLAEHTNYAHQIKSIEGLVVAAETLGGEVIFFSLSGKILKKFGYGYSLTFCFIGYSLRLGLISLVPNPWWVILIEFFMQGATYGLCYTIIVGFASIVAPPGTSATVQGIIAGMDDGLGFALGSILGGYLYNTVGGQSTLRIFSIFSAITAVSFFIVYITILKHHMPKTKVNKHDNEEKNKNIAWKNPQEAIEDCETADADIS